MMNNKKYRLIAGALLIMVFSVFTSCDEGGDQDPGATSVVEMAGDWYLQWDGAGPYYLMSTYNTAADDGSEMWLDDHQNFWWFKAKTLVNTSDFTFSGNDLPSNVDGYEITVSVTNGIITKGTATTSGGNTSDGISFDIEFSDDPGSIYSLVGYKRTGFLEDEH